MRVRLAGVSKPLKLTKKPVELAPGSRIRRQPAPVQTALEPPTPQQEVLTGIAGMVLFAIALAVLIIGISVATIFHVDPRAAARAAQFGQCYDAEGSNCVLDGDTIYVQGQKTDIAGLTAPRIQGAKCDDERSRGIDAAVRLASLLNGGKVSIGPSVREPDGQLRQKVEVGGNDVAPAMIGAGMARDYGNSDGWCSE